MTSYGCPRCEERHGRWSSISPRRCLYFDGTVDIEQRGCSSCPQCIAIYCARCADELEGICECGGELVYGIIYKYSGDGRLPPEITRYKTQRSRLRALDRLRASRRMILAEYKQQQRLIRICARYARKYRVPMPDNPGYFDLLEATQEYGVSPLEAWGFLAEYAVPSNVDDMLKLLDDRCLAFILRQLDSYPVDNCGWDEFERKYDDLRFRPEEDVPKRSAAEMVNETRTWVTLLRKALSKRNTN